MVIFYTILSGSSLTTITRSISAVVCFLVLWTLTMTIMVSLQCQPPKVWDLSGKCFNLVHHPRLMLLSWILLTCWKVALWKYFGVINIAIESLLFIFPSVLVYRLHMPLQKRLVAIAFLSVRILWIPHSGFYTAPNLTDWWTPVEQKYSRVGYSATPCKRIWQRRPFSINESVALDDV